LAVAYSPARDLLQLEREYKDVDFLPLRGFPSDWDSETEINEDRVRMSTAALLHFEGDAAALVRWQGGPHTAAHRDVDHILATLAPMVDPVTLSDLARIYRSGIPAQCNAAASEANFQAYLTYGNHKSVDEYPEKTLGGLIKDYKKGYLMLFDPRLVHFTLNCHLTPGGMVDLNHPYKDPRPVFDATFRPEPWAFAINDWTSPRDEPELPADCAFMQLLIWIYNLRITYPAEEIYLGDDDVSGAYRLLKHHPNVVAMHSSLPCGRFAMSTGSTFGGCFPPSNWAAVARARQQAARYLWMDPDDTVSKAAAFLPPVTFEPLPSRMTIAGFTSAEPDSQNLGVLNPDGSRKPPPYHHHVDDNVYADVKEHMVLTLSASALGLFTVFGFPQPEVPNPLSLKKLNTRYGPDRKILGYSIETRRMVVALLVPKRQQIVALLKEWTIQPTFDLREASSLHGILESISRYSLWGRTWFFALQNCIRQTMQPLYYPLKRRYEKSGRIAQITALLLPRSLMKRLTSLIAREQAALLWHSRIRVKVTPELRACVVRLFDYLSDFERPWSQPIGFIIPRDPHMESAGDASLDAGGAFSESLRYWTDIVWSPAVRHSLRKLKPSDPAYLHINMMEFVVVILQTAAAVTRLDTMSVTLQRELFPRGIPDDPILRCLTDNISSLAWANRVTSSSRKGQQLISVYADIIHSRHLGQNCTHIAGEKNIIPDDISRPTDFSLSHPARCQQLFQKHPSLRRLDYFQPSAGLLSALSSALFTRPPAVPSSLPRSLGHFVPAGSTFSCSPTL